MSVVKTPQVLSNERLTESTHVLLYVLVDQGTMICTYLPGDCQVESFSHSGNSTVGQIVSTNTLNCFNASTSLQEREGEGYI